MPVADAVFHQYRIHRKGGGESAGEFRRHPQPEDPSPSPASTTPGIVTSASISAVSIAARRPAQECGSGAGSPTRITRRISSETNPIIMGRRAPGSTTTSYSSFTTPSMRSQCTTSPLRRSIT